MNDEIEAAWPDPDLRDAALLRCLERVYSQRLPRERTGLELTAAELNTLRALAAGLNRAEAATALGYSLEGVKTHLRAVRRVLAAKTNAHAVAEGFRAGLLT